jgi:hypothetical protein
MEAVEGRCFAQNYGLVDDRLAGENQANAL